MGGLERDQHVHVIRDSSDALGLGAKSSNCTAEIVVEGCSPRLNEPRLAIFPSGGDVMVEACMGGRHWLREPLASLPGSALISTQFQGCGFAQPLAGWLGKPSAFGQREAHVSL